MAKISTEQSNEYWKVLIEVMPWPEVLAPWPYMWSGHVHAKNLQHANFLQHADLHVPRSLVCHTASVVTTSSCTVCATTQFTDQSHDARSRDVQFKAWLCCSMYEHDLGNTAWVCNANFMVQCSFVARVVKHLASMPLLQRYRHFQAHNSLQQWRANRRAWSSADQHNYNAAIQRQATTYTEPQIKHCNVA